MKRRSQSEKDYMKSRSSFCHNMMDIFSQKPNIEISSNTWAVIEGSKGVIEYSDKIIRINLGDFSVAFIGRGMGLKCISPTSLEVVGFFTNIEFSM